MSRGGPGERTRGRDDYETPPWLFKLLSLEFDFDIDAAADEQNHLCREWYGPGGLSEDALTGRWKRWGRHFLNPPFNQMRAFMERVVEQECTTLVVAPAAVDRQWYLMGVERATEVRPKNHGA